MSDVSHICHIHDPQGRYIQLVREYYPYLSKFYTQMYVVVTEKTNWEVIEALEREGVKVVMQDGGGAGLEFISDARRQVLKASLKGGHEYSHFVDLDRIIRWYQTFPEELRNVIEMMPRYDFLVIGRSERAFKTHPRSQVEADVLANEVCSLLLGQNVDIMSSARGISREAAEIILKYSSARFCDSDSEWPMIIRSCSELSVGYVEVDGLEYENWLRYSGEVKRFGGVEEFKRDIDMKPETWLHRLRLNRGISETAISTYNSMIEKKLR